MVGEAIYTRAVLDSRKTFSATAYPTYSDVVNPSLARWRPSTRPAPAVEVQRLFCKIVQCSHGHVCHS